MPPTYDDLRAGFGRPPVEYSPVPFWFLNEALEDGRLAWQLRQMHEQHVDAAIMHPRPGLVTEYLSEDFWHALRTCVDTAQALGMRVWAYDEYPWASGIAGGRVPAADPDYVMRGLDLLATKVAGPQALAWAVAPNLVGLSAAPVARARPSTPGRSSICGPSSTGRCCAGRFRREPGASWPSCSATGSAPSTTITARSVGPT